MFRTVRHWWESGRGRITLRLFVFEFVVVVAGVLVAQWLAGLAQQRADYQRMEIARQGSLRDLAMAAKVATDWQKLSTCLADQATEIMQRLAGHQPIDSDLLVNPGTRYIRMTAPTGDDFLLLAKRYGSRDAEFFRFGQSKVEILADHWSEIDDAWDTFELVDPENGPISDRDRDEARAAAARIKALALRSASSDAAGVRGAAEQLHVVPSDPIGGRPARDCGEFEREKAMYPQLSGRSRYQAAVVSIPSPPSLR